METLVSPFSCSLILIEMWFPWVPFVELLFYEVCIFEVFVGVPDFVVFWWVSCPLSFVLEPSVVLS